MCKTSVKKTNLTKTYALRVSKDTYLWLTHRTPKTIRGILNNYREGLLVKAVARVLSSPKDTHSSNVTALNFNEYPCTARFFFELKAWCKYTASRKPREIMCVKECVACKTVSFRKKGLLPDNTSTLPKHGEPLKAPRSFGRRDDPYNERWNPNRR